ncbi:AraC family transcriptional regulator [Vibrio aquimaris]|uniref:Nitrogen regulation protein NR(I) n=1 Tax=Vibrio aquimaris TaxID=2587862 RepID=A0A5P9CQM5_9VIBR|nr:AraC family transcriptional regulator [Vibrio aquimaris]QFT28514.1 Nitrogen regulation protein NR(I) [Vibrio aquimaris]
MHKTAIISSPQRNQAREKYDPKQLETLIDCPPIMGNSENIVRTKQQILYASQASLPIFIYGETGTEKRAVAQAIHKNRCLTFGRFVCVPEQIAGFDEFQFLFSESIKKAENGTLFLAEVDKLSDKNKDYLTYIFSNREIYNQLAKANTQLIISSEHLLTEQKHFLSKTFSSHAPFLELSLDPLRERAQDISQYIDYFMEKFGCGNPAKITPPAKERLCQLSWPQNVYQLQRVMVFLVSSCTYQISEEDIVNLGIPESIKACPDLIDALLTKDLEVYRHIHIGLYKALEYLSRHFLDDVSLHDLSNACYTSPSHLSFLFREHLNRPFKSILVQLRMQHAKELIANCPTIKITDVCLQSGFGDLSHFEKMFKRHFGSTPRKFRESQRQAHAKMIS